MAFRDQGGDRKMYQGSWKCSECGTTITELPFEPSGDLPLYCRDCHRERRNKQGGGGGGGRDGFQRKMYQGDWKCSACGTAITELPFEPNPDQDIQCRECYRSQKQ